MKKPAKTLLIVVGAIVALLIVVAVAVSVLVDLNKYKPQIETAASEATGLDVKVNGKIALKIFPGPAVSVRDIRIKGEKEDVFSVSEVRVAVEFGPLLRKQLSVTELSVRNPVVNIVKGKDGKFNFEGAKAPKPEPKPEAEDAASPIAGIAADRIVVSNGKLTYADMQTGTKAAVDNFTVTVDDLAVDAAALAEGAEPLRAVELKGTLKADSAAAQAYKVTNIKAGYTLKDAVATLKNLTLDLYGGKASGNGKVDMSGSAMEVAIEQNIRDVDLGALTEAMKGERMMDGKAQLTADLKTRGKAELQLKRNLGGAISLRGDGLTYKGADIDEMLKQFEETQKVGVLDVGSFMVLGPLGPLITKSTDVAQAYGATASGKKTAIKKLVCDWDVKSGVAKAKDVAFSTPNNRVGVKGSLDIAKEEYVGLTAGVLDPQGCAKFKQTINGPFNKPRIEKKSLLTTALKPVTGILGKIKGVAAPTEQKCQVFYTGSVEHPSPQ